MIWRALLTIAFLLIGVQLLRAEASTESLSQTEAHLLARLQKETDPVRKSKAETRLARVKLEQAIQAYGLGNVEQGAQLVSAYLARIKDSWELLRNCGKNAARDSRGFKELDIELREDVRFFEDLKRRVSYLDRAPLEQTGKELERVRAQVLQALFPAARTTEATKPLGKTD
jgi:hypothetical protein